MNLDQLLSQVGVVHDTIVVDTQLELIVKAGAQYGLLSHNPEDAIVAMRTLIEIADVAIDRDQLRLSAERSETGITTRIRVGDGPQYEARA